MTSKKNDSLPAGIAAAVFDLDGTLYTISALGFHIFFGLPADIRLLRKLFSTRDEMRGKDLGDCATLKAVFAETLGRQCGLSAAEALDWYENRFMIRFIHVLSKRGRVRDGLIPLLENLQKNGLRLGVVSDFGRVKERLSALRIPLALFDEIAGAEDFGVMKPTAKPFLHFARRWGISGSQMVLIGDRADHDRESARLLNASFIGIENKNNTGDGFRPWPEVIRLLGGLGHF